MNYTYTSFTLYVYRISEALWIHEKDELARAYLLMIIIVIRNIEV